MPLYDADDTYSGAFRVMEINGTTIRISQHTPALQIYNVVVDVIRLVRVATSTGTEESEQIIVSSLAAHIRWRSGSEKVLFDKNTYFRDATLRCRQPVVTVTTNDRIRYNGLDYEIVGIVDVKNLGILLSMEIRRVQ